MKEQLYSIQKKYEENTVIQSMNDMKEQYIELEKKHAETLKYSVSKYRYVLLANKYENLVRACAASVTFLDHAVKMIDFVDDCTHKEKAENTCITVRDLLKDALPEQGN